MLQSVPFLLALQVLKTFVPVLFKLLFEGHTTSLTWFLLLFFLHYVWIEGFRRKVKGGNWRDEFPFVWIAILKGEGFGRKGFGGV